MNSALIFITIVNAGALVVWGTIYVDRGNWKSRALRAEEKCDQKNETIAKLEREKKNVLASDPYRTPGELSELSKPTEPSSPKPPKIVVGFTPPQKPTCPACGDVWAWADRRPLCACDESFPSALLAQRRRHK